MTQSQNTHHDRVIRRRGQRREEREATDGDPPVALQEGERYRRSPTSLPARQTQNKTSMTKAVTDAYVKAYKEHGKHCDLAYRAVLTNTDETDEPGPDQGPTDQVKVLRNDEAELRK
ncbi:hypothetical protein PRZ48_008276 [Zasmidium cellare]|uniref:Uncharacterized protein n=1 Tax=Zasmidium cellare TaxID=395010 RepID=A0ABR0EF28_ZASCE|nr:hypothetical protein PRZ48_008276 [Zasmidium cellare]